MVLATPPHVTRALLQPLDHGARMAGLLPQQATSAIVVALAFAPEQAARLRIPRGFGFVVPQLPAAKAGIAPVAGLHLRASEISRPRPARGGAAYGPSSAATPAMRCWAKQTISSSSAPACNWAAFLVRCREAAETVVRRWPQSLPQYAVGHLERMAELESMLSAMPGLHLVGSAYHGVGLPDLIRQGRAIGRLLAGQPHVTLSRANGETVAV